MQDHNTTAQQTVEANCIEYTVSYDEVFNEAVERVAAHLAETLDMPEEIYNMDNKYHRVYKEFLRLAIRCVTLGNMDDAIEAAVSELNKYVNSQES